VSHKQASKVHSRITPQGRKVSAYEIATRYKGTAYAAPDLVVAHARTLRGMGLPSGSIARDAGVSEDYLVHLLAEKHPVLRIRQATAIMSVSHRPNERQQRVLAIGAGRRLGALQTLCWSGTYLATRTHLTPVDISHLIHQRPVVMDWDKWKAISDVFEELSGTIGDSPKSRTFALRRGDPTPFDWYGLDIDDPRITAPASGREPPKTIREQSAWRAVEAADHLALGSSVEQIARRMGISERQVERLLKRDTPLQLYG
jgi:hypothetical protein